MEENKKIENTKEIKDMNIYEKLINIQKEKK